MTDVHDERHTRKQLTQVKKKLCDTRERRDESEDEPSSGVRSPDLLPGNSNTGIQMVVTRWP